MLPNPLVPGFFFSAMRVTNLPLRDELSAALHPQCQVSARSQGQEGGEHDTWDTNTRLLGRWSVALDGDPQHFRVFGVSARMPAGWPGARAAAPTGQNDFGPALSLQQGSTASAAFPAVSGE
jgi:hypothetical protein